jgi:tRNA pseudouridine38-40 synthase
MRLAVALEYDGAGYAGWQIQPALRSIQAVTEEAFARVADQPVSLVCAGRTDAGVHALGQIAHFDTSSRRAERGWVLGANTYLPRDVSVTWVRRVPQHFHARYSAEARTYRYFIFNRTARSALAAPRATLVHYALDEQRMRTAAAMLLGEHDFSSFRSSECQARSAVRRVHELTVERQGEWISIGITANAFLHHMVRNIAGLLIVIGRGKEEPEWAASVLAARDRTLAAPTAPPEGLYLWNVRYPEAFGLPGADGGPTSAMIPALGR